MPRFSGKVAIITGAASGIGLAIARRYVEEGASVAIADLNADAAKAAAADLTKLGPGKAIGLAMDVTSEAQVNDGVAKVVQQWGGVDILVSNAGIQIVAPLDEFEFAKPNWPVQLHPINS